MMRPLRQGRRTGPPAPYRIRFNDDNVVDDKDMALLALDLDRVRALVGGPGQKDAAVARTPIQRKSRGVFERLLVEAARFKPRSDANGNAGPARDAVERMPAVVKQDAAAR